MGDQRKSSDSSANMLGYHWSNAKKLSFTNQGGSLDSGIGAQNKLRPVNLSGLRLFLKTIGKCKFSDQMRISELIARDVVLLSNLSVIDRIFSREYLMHAVGALECEPEKPITVKKHHRSLLETAIKEEHVIFKENLPVKNKSVLTKLCQSFVVGYIKVFSKLLADSRFIQELRAKLKSDGISLDSKRDLPFFFCELWSFNESAENERVSEFWWDIVDGDTYNITVKIMQTIISQNDEHCLRRIVKNNLFRLIIEIFYEVGNRFYRLHGGVLNLLEYIATENVKVLVIYLWETFSEKLEKFEHFKGP